MSISQVTVSRKLLALGAAIMVAAGFAALVVDGRQINSLRSQVTSLNTEQVQQAEASAYTTGQMAGQIRALKARLDAIPAAASNCPVTGAGRYQSCVREPNSSRPSVGQEITSGSGSDPGTPWQVTDYQGAPMAWVNLYGLYSGGDGGKMPGGPICITYSVTSTSACLTPVGTLTLTPTGPEGPTGPTVTLTAADVAWIHAHGG